MSLLRLDYANLILLQAKFTDHFLYIRQYLKSWEHKVRQDWTYFLFSRGYSIVRKTDFNKVIT